MSQVRPRTGEVDVRPFQARYHELRARGVAATDMAERAGFVRSDLSRGDSAPLKRALGLLPSHSSRSTKYVYFSHHMTYAVAVRIATALDMDPLEAGL